MIIYKVTNRVNGKIYIGQTIYTLKHRRKQHENSIKYNNSSCRAFVNALKKYGIENFEWEIIDRAKNRAELNHKESYWIDKLSSLVDYGKGYNLNKGGDSPQHSNETKKRISNAQLGKKNHMFGVRGADNHSSKPVINMTTKVIYSSATECAEKEGVEVSKVCSVCRGERASTNYTVYRYLDNNNNIINPSKDKIFKKNKPIINVLTGQVFNTAKDCCLSMGVSLNSASNLQKTLKNNKGIAWWCENLWRYEELENFQIPQKPTRKIPKNSKKVLNITTNTIYDTISLAAKSIGKNYRNLATSLRNGNGYCIWNKNEWRVIEDK